MAAPMKKRVVDHRMDDGQPSNSDESDSFDENDEAMDDNSVDHEVQVEFAACTPEGGDYEGLKQQLKQLFLKAHVDIGALADLILQQTHVTSVIKQSELPEDDTDSDDADDDVVFGLTSVVNITEKRDVPCVKQIVNLILQQCAKHGSNQVQKVVNDALKQSPDSKKHTGLIINERLVNIPPQIAAPLFENLSKEIKSAREKNLPFWFDVLILICKTYKMEESQGKKVVTKTIFPKPEEEILNEESLVNFEYCIAGESDSALDGEWDADDEGMKPYHRILVVPADKLDTIISRIRQAFATPT